MNRSYLIGFHRFVLLAFIQSEVVIRERLLPGDFLGEGVEVVGLVRPLSVDARHPEVLHRVIQRSPDQSSSPERLDLGRGSSSAPHEFSQELRSLSLDVCDQPSGQRH